MKSFENKVVVITGAASGIGKALARQLVQRGARVAIADLAADHADAVARELGPRARAYRCDVTEREDVEALARSVRADMGAIHLVFANAGIAVGGKVTDADPREFKWVMDVNVGGVFSTMQVFVPLLIETASRGEEAHFVVTGSENSLGVPKGSPSSVYTASKHALLGLADALRRDLDGSGVGVSILCPGLVATGIWDARRHRQDRYGGAAAMEPQYAERAVKAINAYGQDPEITATVSLEGIANGEFLIVTGPGLRELSTQRLRTVEEALERADRRCSGERSPR